MVLEEYSPELIYIKGPGSLVADALSRLDLLPNIPEINFMDLCSFKQDDFPEDSYPLQWARIEREQNKDRRLHQALLKDKDYNSLGRQKLQYDPLQGQGGDPTVPTKQSGHLVP